MEHKSLNKLVGTAAFAISLFGALSAQAQTSTTEGVGCTEVAADHITFDAPSAADLVTSPTDGAGLVVRVSHQGESPGEILARADWLLEGGDMVAREGTLAVEAVVPRDGTPAEVFIPLGDIEQLPSVTDVTLVVKMRTDLADGSSESAVFNLVVINSQEGLAVVEHDRFQAEEPAPGTDLARVLEDQRETYAGANVDVLFGGDAPRRAIAIVVGEGGDQ